MFCVFLVNIKNPYNYNHVAFTNLHMETKVVKMLCVKCCDTDSDS